MSTSGRAAEKAKKGVMPSRGMTDNPKNSATIVGNARGIRKKEGGNRKKQPYSSG